MNLKQSKKQLINFTWLGINHHGKSIHGRIAAATLPLAKMQLRRQGIIVKRIHKQSKWLAILTRKPIKTDSIAAFSRQLATMITASIPLIKALDIIMKSNSHNSLVTIIEQIKIKIENGASFTEAINQYPRYFDYLFCNLVSAGEQSGTLDIMLERIATHQEKQQSLKKKLRKALSYPIIVIIIALVVTMILLIKVIPKFAVLFESTGGQLPLLTQWVITTAKILQHYWLIFFISLLLSITLNIIFYRRSKKFHQLMDKLLLMTPIVGTIIQKTAIARFCRTLATIYSAGIPLINALEISAKVIGNLIYRQAIIKISNEVAAGEQFNYAMQKVAVFPSIIIEMVAIGEESGKLEMMIDKAANHYEEDIDLLVDNLTHLLEPVIMSILGILVGGLVIAMYLPIFKLGQAF